jgi:hypothetical protein
MGGQGTGEHAADGAPETEQALATGPAGPGGVGVEHEPALGGIGEEPLVTVPVQCQCCFVVQAHRALLRVLVRWLNHALGGADGLRQLTQFTRFVRGSAKRSASEAVEPVQVVHHDRPPAGLHQSELP